MRKVLSALLAATLVLSTTACSQPAQSTETQATQAAQTTQAAAESPADDLSGEFKLATYLQLSGSGAAYGTQALNSIKIAADYVNENGGFNGQKVVVKEYDTQCTTEEAVKVVQKIISEGDISAVIGSVNSSEVLASGSYLNDAGVVLLGLGTSATWMQQDWEYVWRPACNVTLLAGAAANQAVELGLKDVGVLHTPDDVGKTTATKFVEAAAEAGLNVVADEEVAADDTDFSAQINNVLAKNPEVMYLSLAGDSFGVCIKQLRQNGFEGLIIMRDAISTNQTDIAGQDACNYVSFVYPYITYNTVDECTDPNMAEFLKKYEAAYGSLPASEVAYRGWDAVVSLWEASKIAGANDAESLNAAMPQVQVQGLGGTLDFSEGGEGYAKCNSSFIFLDGKSIAWGDWYDGDNYKTFMSEKYGK